MPVSNQNIHKHRGKRGFQRASGLLQERIRKASESRGFSQSRILTHWAEIAGAEIAQICKPVSVSYSKGGFGAALTVLTTGAQAPMLQMQLETLREKVNACYGYPAIKRIHITQTAPTGFAEGQVAFAHPAKPKPQPDEQAQTQARQAAAAVGDNSLRSALEKLGENVLTRARENKG